jgi:hypothetical protein
LAIASEDTPVKIFIAILFCLTICAVSTGAAELVECNGTWTNKPCDKATGAPLEEKPVRELTQAEKEMNSKKLWLHDLEMQVIQVRRETGINIKFSTTQDVCLRTESSLSDCQRAISETQSALVNALMAKISSGNNRDERDQSAGVQQNSTVVVVEDDWAACNSLTDPRCNTGRRAGGQHDHRHRDRKKPATAKAPPKLPQPGQHQGTENIGIGSIKLHENALGHKKR